MARRQQGSWRYLYERLGDKEFQRLCATLVQYQFGDATCFPVGQKDGGRDVARRVRVGGGAEHGELHIYQVKWTGQASRDPVPWLEKSIVAEEANIRALVNAGATHYHLVTNVAGTSAFGNGSMDRLDAKLTVFEQRFGITMDCWWRDDIDRRIDTAPTELKWSYPDMLAGVDAVRYLMADTSPEATNDELRAQLLGLMATQWREDAVIKFKQVELEHQDLASLFVDVEARRLGTDREAARRQIGFASPPESVGGAAAYLLTAATPMTLVRGEPGQGKSTLTQLLCQAHRAEFLPEEARLGAGRPELRPRQPRVPFRVELRDYAAWLDGADPLGEQPAPSRRRRPKTTTVEAFLARLLTAGSGGVPASVATINRIFERFPCLVVLDGLDEVARPGARARVVEEIEAFAVRFAALSAAPRLVVTTRPNATDLAEPSTPGFEVLSLSRLAPPLRTAYLRKWADSRGVRGADRRALQRTFDARVSEPHIAQLADNPMQLTILLYLLHQRGDSVPHGRTPLYTSYMQTLLDREAAKSTAVQQHRDDLEEVTAFLGWFLQSQAEVNSADGQMPVPAIKSKINTYLYDIGRREARLADDLFTAVTDRVWALTSKTQGTFEFDVQPVREYFAAKFLYDFAALGRYDVLRSTILRQLLRRAYWLNTGRFYAGFAGPNEISGLVDGLCEEWEETRQAHQVRAAAWVLLSDGVFQRRPRAQAQVVRLLTDDLGIRLLNRDLREDPDLRPLPDDRGGATLRQTLLEQIAAQPGHPLAAERIQLAARHLPERRALHGWWHERMAAATGTDQEAWLRLGAATEAGESLTVEEADALLLAGPAGLQAALNAGVTLASGSATESRLLDAVLDGLASEITSSRAGVATDLARLLGPQQFLRRASLIDQAFQVPVGHADPAVTSSQRQALLARLAARFDEFPRVTAALRYGKGQAGTTSPFGNTARELATIVGRRWLPAEIAVIGAAADREELRTGGDLTPGSFCLGSEADYGRLLQEVRQFYRARSWWQEHHDGFPDPLSRGVWALALCAVADPQVVAALVDRLDAAVAALPVATQTALLLSSSRLGASGISRRLPPALLSATANLSPVTSLLLAHHSVSLTHCGDIPELSRERLVAMASSALVGWPAARALTARMGSSSTADDLAALRACGSSAVIVGAHPYEDIPAEAAAAIVSAPADFPLTWLLAAERRVARADVQRGVAALADEQLWFAV